MSQTLCSAEPAAGALVYEEQAAAHLQRLGLSTAKEHLDTVCQQAAAGAWSYSHFLGYLLEGEVEERHRRTVALSLQFARFPYLKRLADFDFAAQPGIDRRLIDELATGRFLFEGRNVVFLGPPGVGKTHLAISLGTLTAQMGHRVYFTTAIDLARKLTQATEHNRLHRQLNALTQPKLLIIDEVGYLSLDATQASLLFQVLCRRYEKEQSVVLTSNKAFSDWARSLPTTRSWPRPRWTGSSIAARWSISAATATGSRKSGPPAWARPLRYAPRRRARSPRYGRRRADMATNAQRQAAYRKRRRALIDGLLAGPDLPALPAVLSIPGWPRWKEAMARIAIQLCQIEAEMAHYYDQRTERWQEAEVG